jgi:hypothetical protein
MAVLEYRAVDTQTPSDRALSHNRRLADALMRADSSLEVTQRRREVELEGDNAQILLWDEYAAIALPFDFDDVDGLEEKLKVYFKVLRDVAGYVIYDPQSEELLDPDHGPRFVTEALRESAA